MVELVKDEKNVKIVEGKIHVTRHVEEIYEPDEMMRTYTSLEMRMDKLKEDMAGTEEMLKDLSGQREEVEKLDKARKEAAKKELQKAMAEQSK